MKLTKTEFKILELFDAFIIGGKYIEHEILGKLYQVDKFAISEFVKKEVDSVISVDMVDGVLEEMEYAGALVGIESYGRKYYTAVQWIESDEIYNHEV